MQPCWVAAEAFREPADLRRAARVSACSPQRTVASRTGRAGRRCRELPSSRRPFSLRWASALPRRRSQRASRRAELPDHPRRSPRCLQSPAGRSRYQRLAARLSRAAQRILRRPRGDPAKLTSAAFDRLSSFRLGPATIGLAFTWTLLNWAADACCLIISVKAIGVTAPAAATVTAATVLSACAASAMAMWLGRSSHPRSGSAPRARTVAARVRRPGQRTCAGPAKPG